MLMENVPARALAVPMIAVNALRVNAARNAVVKVVVKEGGVYLPPLCLLRIG